MSLLSIAEQMVRSRNSAIMIRPNPASVQGYDCKLVYTGDNTGYTKLDLDTAQKIVDFANGLRVIANMKVDDKTDHAQLTALIIAIARITLEQGGESWKV